MAKKKTKLEEGFTTETGQKKTFDIQTGQTFNNGVSAPAPSSLNFQPDTTTKGMGVFRNQQTGAVSGVQMPDGRTFLGLSPDEAQAIIDRENRKAATPEGALEMPQIARQEEGKKLVGEVGQINPQENIQKEPANIGQALAEGGRQAAIGAAGAGVIGGVATAATGGLALPVAAIATGAAAIGGFVKGVVQSLAQQKGENIQAEFSNLARTTRNLRAIITDTNQGGSAADNIDLFNSQLTLIDESYSKLYLENKNKFLGKDATTQLENFENFYSVGGSRELLIREMQQAILNPNPSKTLINMGDLPLE